MDESQPEVALVKPPMSTEQSRAQRLERQQARFRDRGGIFIPSNRNTLVDMLLGRKAKSARKSHGSALSSPRKRTEKTAPRKGNGTDDTMPSRRSSPRKMTRKPAAYDSTTPSSSNLPAAVGPETTEQPFKSHTATKRIVKGKAKSGETAKKRRKAITATAQSRIDDGPLGDKKVDKSPAKAKSRRKPTTKTARKNQAKKSEPIHAHTMEETYEDPLEVLPKTRTKGKGKKISNSSAKNTATNNLDRNANEACSLQVTNTELQPPKAKSKAVQEAKGCCEVSREIGNVRESQLNGNSATLRTQTTASSRSGLDESGARHREDEKSQRSDSDIYPVPSRKRPMIDTEIASEGPSSKRTKVLQARDELPHDQTGPQTRAPKRVVTSDTEEDNGKKHAVSPPKSNKRSRAPKKETQGRRKRGKVESENDLDVDKKGNKRTAKKTTKASRSAKTSDEKPSSTNIHDLKLRLKLQPRKSVMQRIKEPLPDIEDDEPDPIDCLC